MKIQVVDQKLGKTEDYTFKQESILVGRGTDCDLRIIADGISRHHAKIFREGTSLFIQDLGSSNGTFINEKRIEKEEFTTFFPAQLGFGVILNLVDF